MMSGVSARLELGYFHSSRGWKSSFIDCYRQTNPSEPVNDNGGLFPPGTLSLLASECSAMYYTAWTWARQTTDTWPKMTNGCHISTYFQFTGFALFLAGASLATRDTLLKDAKRANVSPRLDQVRYSHDDSITQSTVCTLFSHFVLTCSVTF